MEVSNTTAKPPIAEGSYDPYAALDIDAFLKLMITELQNQDPLNPMDNAAMLQQISQLQSIQSNKQLSETLDSIVLGQSLASATALIDQHVNGLTDEGEEVSGVVQRVSVEEGVPRLIVGEHTMKLTNVRAVGEGE